MEQDPVAWDQGQAADAAARAEAEWAAEEQVPAVYVSAHPAAPRYLIKEVSPVFKYPVPNAGLR